MKNSILLLILARKVKGIVIFRLNDVAFEETKTLSRVGKCASYLLSYATNDLTFVWAESRLMFQKR